MAGSEANPEHAALTSARIAGRPLVRSSRNVLQTARIQQRDHFSGVGMEGLPCACAEAPEGPHQRPAAQTSTRMSGRLSVCCDFPDYTARVHATGCRQARSRAPAQSSAQMCKANTSHRRYCKPASYMRSSFACSFFVVLKFANSLQTTGTALTHTPFFFASFGRAQRPSRTFICAC